MSDDVVQVTIWGHAVEWTPAAAAKAHPQLWAQVETLFPMLPEDGHLAVVLLMEQTCGSCHDAAIGCQCWNDE